MARDFTKSTINYLSLGSSKIGPLINGAGVVSCHCWANLDGVDNTGTLPDRFFQLLVNGISTGVAFGTDTAGHLKAVARSVSTDTLQSRAGTTVLPLSTWISVGAVVNFASDFITPYYAGVAEGGGAVSFANSAYTHGVPTDNDTIGGNLAPPSGNSTQVDGRIAEVAVWNDDIGAAGFAMLALGISARFVRPEALVFYKRLIGNISPEPEIISGIADTINGSLPKADHPRIIMPGLGHQVVALVSGNVLQGLGGSIASSATVGRLISKSFTANETPLSALLKQANLTLEGAETANGELAIQAQKPIASSETPSGGVAKATEKLKSGSLIPVAIVAKQASKISAGVVTPGGVVTAVKGMVRSLGGALLPSSLLTKSSERGLAGLIALSGALSALRAVLVSLTGSLAPTGLTTKSILHSLLAGIVPVGGMVRFIHRVLNSAVWLAGSAVNSILALTVKLDVTSYVGEVTYLESNDVAVNSIVSGDSGR